jgi:hypothetical protein
MKLVDIIHLMATLDDLLEIYRLGGGRMKAD